MPTHQFSKTLLNESEELIKQKPRTSRKTIKNPSDIYSQSNPRQMLDQNSIQNLGHDNIKHNHQPDSQQLHHQNLNFRLNIFSIIAILILISNIFLVFELQPKSNLGISNQAESSTTIVSPQAKNTINPLNSTTNTENGFSKTINTFQNNPSLVDLGFKVDIGKNYIANLEDPNCQTPVVPPTVNGCGFAILLSSLGIPDSGIAYKSVSIEANFKDPDGKIQIDQKNYENGAFNKTVGILSAESLSNAIVLPVDIPASDALFFRFWTKIGTVMITRISINYDLVKNSKKVSFLSKFNAIKNPMEI